MKFLGEVQCISFRNNEGAAVSLGSPLQSHQGQERLLLGTPIHIDNVAPVKLVCSYMMAAASAELKAPSGALFSSFSSAFVSSQKQEILHFYANPWLFGILEFGVLGSSRGGLLNFFMG